MLKRACWFLLSFTLWNVCMGAERIELSSSEADQLRSAYKDSAYAVDGKLNPERVPDAIRFKLFFFRYASRPGYVQALASHITPSDAAVLAAYSKEHARLVAEDDHAKAAAFDAVMSRAEQLNAGELAAEFDSIYKEFERKSLARYESVLAKLSAGGSAAVRQFAFEHVRPSFTLHNDVAVAARLPALYKRSVLQTRNESRAKPAAAEPTGPSQAKALSTTDPQIRAMPQE